MEKYFYRIRKETPLGKKWNKLWHDCQKAEKAQMEFGKKCGAEEVVPMESAFEGGVIGFIFADDKKVNRTVWREIIKDRDDRIIWRPNCEHREGAQQAKSEKYRGRNTATRIYQYGQVGWERVKHLFPDADKEAMKDTKWVRYTELYRTDTDKGVRDMSKLQRDAISIEHERMMLPVVTVQRIFLLLEADLTVDLDKEKELQIVQQFTPTFFDLDNYWYVGCAYPCKAEGMEEISKESYFNMRTDLLRVMRDIEAQNA